jgi:GGDEF domain-containing protein
MSTYEHLAADLSFVMEGISDGLWRLDRQGAIVGANQQVSDWLGRSSESLLGRPAAAYLEREDGRPLLEEGVFPVRSVGRRLICLSRESAGSWIQILVEDRRHSSDAPQANPGGSRLAALCTESEFLDALDEAGRLARRLPFAVAAFLIQVHGAPQTRWEELIPALRARFRSALRNSDFLFEPSEGRWLVILRGIAQEHVEAAMTRLERALQSVIALPEGAALLSCVSGAAHCAEGREGLLELAQERLWQKSEGRRAA